MEPFNSMKAGLPSRRTEKAGIEEPSEVQQEKMHEKSARNNRHELKQKWCIFDLRRNFFSMRTVKNWLPRETVQSPSLSDFRVDPAGGWTRDLLRSLAVLEPMIL